MGRNKSNEYQPEQAVKNEENIQKEDGSQTHFDIAAEGLIRNKICDKMMLTQKTDTRIFKKEKEKKARGRQPVTENKAEVTK